MIKVKALEGFSFGRFAEIKNLIRANSEDKEGHISKDDIFECNEEIAKYLTNEIENPAKRELVEIIEVIPEKKIRTRIKKNN